MSHRAQLEQDRAGARRVLDDVLTETWEVEDGGFWVCLSTAEHGGFGTIEQMNAGSFRNSPELTEARMRLIASAPMGVQLARALQNELKVLATWENGNGTFDVAVSREVLHQLQALAEQLLATAEGSSR